tara:strand:- start:1408 stop:1983 length:576 start_codon:yes stop_codon:yes gene_type:complete
MAFWSTGTGNDPKRGFRFQLLNGNIPAYTVKKVSKPSFTVNESTHKYLNHTYYYPGSVEWQTVSFTLVDPVNPDAAATLANIIREGGYAPLHSPQDKLSSTSKASALSALGEIKIQQLDANGDAVETWTLKNAWVKDVKFGDLDYESDDLTEVEVEVRYDYATLETANKGTNQEAAGETPGPQTSFWKAGS